ncbi:MAG: DUF4314 domain-containing protein [Clostridia bacterium]|nr:DUF4314 domain-containing protein [Clostridia bacterium]
MKIQAGTRIKILYMHGEPQYTNKEGVVTHVDDAKQIHGTWGGCALTPGIDTFEKIAEIPDFPEFPKSNGIER